MNIYEKVMNIQIELKSPKSQYNSFGKYHFRNLEDIQESLKPLLDKYKVVINITDEMVLIGERYYIKATASIKDTEKEGEISSTAYAREAETQKGMNDSQLSGSTSSYARKYALNGLLAIDDTKDSDTTNTHGKEQPSDYKTNVGTKGDLASEKQLGFIHNLVKSKDYGVDNISKYIKDNYKKDSSKELTGKEASEIIKMLNGK